MNKSSLKINVASALILNQGLFLLQLRDATEGISYPSHWGLFGGHLKNKESPISGLKRELWEELELKFKLSKFLGIVKTKTHCIHIFLIPWHGNISSLSLHEGQEIGVFGLKHIFSGELKSPESQRSYPVTRGCLACFRYYREHFHSLKGI